MTLSTEWFISTKRTVSSWWNFTNVLQGSKKSEVKSPHHNCHLTPKETSRSLNKVPFQTVPSMANQFASSFYQEKSGL